MGDSSLNMTSFGGSFLSKNRRKIAEVVETDSIGRFFLVDALIRRYEACCSYFRADRPSWRENRQWHSFGFVGRSPANRALIWSCIIESISGQRPLRRPVCCNALWICDMVKMVRWWLANATLASSIQQRWKRECHNRLDYGWKYDLWVRFDRTNIQLIRSFTTLG